VTTTQPEQPIAAPVRERGYTRDQGLDGWGFGSRVKTPEMNWPQCLEIFEDMGETEGQITSALEAIVTPIMATGKRLDPRGCRDEVVEHIANDLGVQIMGAEEAPTDEDLADPDYDPAVGRPPGPQRSRRRGRFSLTEHLEVAIPDHLQYGHAVFEQVYFPPGEDGKYHLRKLGFRPPRTIALWDIAPDGGLRAIEQWAPGYLSPGPGIYAYGPRGIRLPVTRLVVYVNGKRGSHWIGRSVFRPAYKHYILKDRLIRRYDTITERNGMGIPTYTAAGTSPAEVLAGQDIADSTRMGDDSGISLPHGATMELLGVKGQIVDVLAGIKYHDEMMARSMLANILNLGQNRGTGSWALGSTLQDVLSLKVQAINARARDTFNDHVIEDIVQLNYGPDEPAPRLVFDEIGSKTSALVQALATLVQNGVLKADEDLETFIRTTLDLPPRGGAQLAPAAPPAPAPEEDE
jgi:hypothetical protein